jgi:ATP-dependent Clp protease ATP-binding subunit ClpA
VADDNTGAGRSDWLPRPDPTALTTAQLLRELSSLREVLDTRLDAMDKATALLADTVNRTPTEIEKQISRLRELTDERFSSIDKQFAERDVRTEQAAKASKEALDAALLAAKELVSQQNEANAAAADKAEQSTIKQIDQIGIRIDTMQKALDDRLTELKERIDRGEGADHGTAASRNEARLNTGQLIQGLILVVAVAAVIVAVVAILKK